MRGPDEELERPGMAGDFDRIIRNRRNAIDNAIDSVSVRTEPALI
jgi:hypothetical protein